MFDFIMNLITVSTGAFIALVVIFVALIATVVIQAVMIHKLSNGSYYESEEREPTLENDRDQYNHKIDNAEKEQLLDVAKIFFTIFRTFVRDTSNLHGIKIIYSKARMVEQSPDMVYMKNYTMDDITKSDMICYIIKLMDTYKGSTVLSDTDKVYYDEMRENMVNRQLQINTWGEKVVELQQWIDEDPDEYTSRSSQGSETRSNGNLFTRIKDGLYSLTQPYDGYDDDYDDEEEDDYYEESKT